MRAAGPGLIPGLIVGNHLAARELPIGVDLDQQADRQGSDQAHPADQFADQHHHVLHEP